MVETEKSQTRLCLPLLHTKVGPQHLQTCGRCILEAQGHNTTCTKRVRQSVRGLYYKARGTCSCNSRLAAPELCHVYLFDPGVFPKLVHVAAQDCDDFRHRVSRQLRECCVHDLQGTRMPLAVLGNACVSLTSTTERPTALI